MARQALTIASRSRFASEARSVSDNHKQPSNQRAEGQMVYFSKFCITLLPTLLPTSQSRTTLFRSFYSCLTVARADATSVAHARCYCDVPKCHVAMALCTIHQTVLI